MAYTTINKSTAHFNTKLHSGTGSTTTITGVGFQPDWTWFKSRSNANNHALYDAVRGASKLIRSNSGTAEQTNTALSAFTSDGVTLTGGDSFTNASGYTYASWNWKAGGGQGSSNTDGSINTTYTSVNTTAGFSISQYTGTGSNATVGHGLGAVPKMIIVKRTNASDVWRVYHGSIGATKHLVLNTTAGEASGSNVWNDTEPTSSVFSISTDSAVNASGATYIAYCFAEKTGYCKIGNYTGNGLTDGTFIYTGFRPSWIMLKRASGDGYEWLIVDNKRDTHNVTTNGLAPNTNSAESGSSYNSLDILSNGFKPRNNETRINNGNGNIIYMAFGQSLVGSNNVPCTAR